MEGVIWKRRERKGKYPETPSTKTGRSDRWWLNALIENKKAKTGKKVIKRMLCGIFIGLPYRTVTIYPPPSTHSSSSDAAPPIGVSPSAVSGEASFR